MGTEEASDNTRGRRRLPRWLPVVLIVPVVLSAWYLYRPSGSLDFDLVDVHGSPLRLKDFRGRVVLLDFMATRCPPCRASMPLLLELHEEVGDEVVFISISVDPVSDAEEKLISWFADWNSSWIHARDLADPPVSQLFKISRIPTFVLIDESGRIVGKHVGLNTLTALIEDISELLGR